jgi:apolipoprotein N-acyltransferase
VAALPAALVLVEWARGAFPFEGVPVATLAQTQVGGPLLEAARVGGPLLVAAAVACAGVAAGLRRLLPAAVAVALVLAGWVAPDGSPSGEVTAALVQGGGPRGTRAIDTDERRVFERHLEASEAVPPGVDLVLWPEDVVDVRRTVTETPEGEALAALAQEKDATLVAGVVTGGGEVFINEAWWWAADGTPGEPYEKNVRVPFGEWIPFRSVVSRLGDVSAVPRDMRVGEGPGILETDSGRFGVLVSWEVFFARRARAADGEVLLNPTNAASFSTSQMPALEVGAARLRAVETGRWLLQAAPTGPTTVIDPRGGVHQPTVLGERAVVTATVERRTGRTVYDRLGDAPLLAAAAIVVAAAWALTRRAGA